MLPRADFKQCISADRCGGLTKIESKLLLNLLPKDSQGNVVYRKLGAGLEQVRTLTLPPCNTSVLECASGEAFVGIRVGSNLQNTTSSKLDSRSLLSGVQYRGHVVRRSTF